MKRIGKNFLIVICFILLVSIGYVVYMLVTYHRIPDKVELVVEQTMQQTSQESEGVSLSVGETYRAVSYNIGFGAYTPDFTFFMDGGASSWAESEESVRATVSGAISYVQQQEPDFVLYQEVDIDSTRSYHVNQYEMIREQMEYGCTVFAQNYDSSFLAYPFAQPHGFCRSGMVTYSVYPVMAAMRRSFPIATSLSKYVDLDRCYSVSRIPTENGRELVLVNVHMSAYGNSDSVRKGQTTMLFDEMQQEYELGNYVVCGGDFNHDLLAEENDVENRASWAYPFPRSEMPEHFSFCMDGLGEEQKNALWMTSRNTNIPYDEMASELMILDGFIVSDNVECVGYENLRTDFAYADHEPVLLEFRLKDAE